MATVELAVFHDARGRRPVIVKRVAVGDSVAALRDEARALLAVRHPNVASLVALVDEPDGGLALVVEYIHGASLRELARALSPLGRRLSLAAAASIIRDAALGLHAAHEARGPDGAPLGLVHRDVSPGNVVVGFDGRARVVDFGIARGAHRTAATTGGAIRGTLEYLSPEQCLRGTVDRRSDVFSLAILLYELSTHARLFHRPSSLQVIRAITTEPITPPSRVEREATSALDAVCLRGLARNPSDRYATAADMATALEPLAGGERARWDVAALVREVFAERDASIAVALRAHGCDASADE